VCIPKDAHWKNCRTALGPHILSLHYRFYRTNASKIMLSKRILRPENILFEKNFKITGRVYPKRCTLQNFPVCIFLDTHYKNLFSASFWIHTTKIFSVCIFGYTLQKCFQCASFWIHTTKIFQLQKIFPVRICLDILVWRVCTLRKFLQHWKF